MTPLVFFLAIFRFVVVLLLVSPTTMSYFFYLNWFRLFQPSVTLIQKSDIFMSISTPGHDGLQSLLPMT